MTKDELKAEKKLRKKEAKARVKEAKARAREAEARAGEAGARPRETEDGSRARLSRLVREGAFQTVVKVIAGLIVAYLVIRFGLR